MSSAADNMQQHKRPENNWGQQCGGNNSKHEAMPKAHRGEVRQLHTHKNKAKEWLYNIHDSSWFSYPADWNEAHPLN